MAQKDPVLVAARFNDEVFLWHIAFVAGWQDQVLSASAIVLTCGVEVASIAQIDLVFCAKCTGRNINDRRSIPLEIGGRGDVHSCIALQTNFVRPREFVNAHNSMRLDRAELLCP